MKFSWPELFRPKPRGWTVFEISDDIVAVSISPPSRPGAKPQVRSCFNAKRDLASPLAAQLANAAKSVQLTGFQPALVLPAGDFEILRVDRPPVKPEELEKSLRWSISALPMASDGQACVDWVEIPLAPGSEKRARQVFAITAQRAEIMALQTAFREAGIKLKAIDVAVTAQRNIAGLLETQGRGCFLVAADSKGVHATVTYQGELYHVHSIPELLFDESSDPTQVAREFDRVALEVQRSMDSVRRDQPFIRIDSVSLAPRVRSIGFGHALANRLLLPTQEIDLSGIFDWGPCVALKTPANQAIFFRVLGAGLRYLGGRS